MGEGPRVAGPFRCAREDSNLHELSAHKALNLNSGVSDASAGRKIGRFVRALGRIGRIWRGVCSHDVLTAPALRLGLGADLTAAARASAFSVKAVV
jgi:hypothetical protein